MLRLEALTAGWDDTEPMKKEYVKRRDYIIEKCPRLGLRLLSRMEFIFLLKSQLVLIKIPSLFAGFA